MSSFPAQALANYVIGLADDELILAHRDSEWAGHAPILEEDIAFANIALDEMGHASLWYQVAAELRGADPERYPDELVFGRDSGEFLNVQLVELPKGDWAKTVMRQYMFDTAEGIRLAALADSDFQPLADAAAKLRPEEFYHLRHTTAWVTRLGLGTEESNTRMQQALGQLYSYALQLFEPLAEESQLMGIVPDSATLLETWKEAIRTVLEAAELSLPESAGPPSANRTKHTEHLAPLVQEMQMVARIEAGAEW